MANVEDGCTAKHFLCSLGARGRHTANTPRSLHSNAGPTGVKSVQSSPYAQTHTTSEIINFGLGQPSESLLPLDMFRDAAMDRFKPTQDPAMLQYGAAKGFIGFREEIAKLVAGANATASVDPETLMVTAGNSQATSHAAMAFSKTHKRVFVEEPTYFLAHDIFRELGLDLKGIHAGKNGIDLDVLEATLAAGDVPAFLYTIPFFHNPTGAVMSSDHCKRLVALAQKYGFRIISDEPYNLLHLGSNGGPLSSLASYDDSVLEQGKLLPHLDHLKSVFQARKAAMCDALLKHCPDVTFIEPSGGYFVWLELPDGVHTDVLLNEAVANHAVAFTPGTRCSLGTVYGDGDGGVLANTAMTRCARLSFAFYDEDEIHLGIQRLQSALANVK
ncbi:aminotransferase, putative [Phytophthora infestans T30-4]|uniref:Aminotransferase, putative n=1 Tax=Phytophthora infestans (strain T30-4) TaxID=403677 RepID=D0NV07_PHYIT|nr:aminotransferase, putative [Phytophthora infestans T30-4]EEY66479.1 aminotransferase, putative [Phytophthora infestans T30-4]|eukprot:XP_002896998.1 aminotransferase, putative [Phytophthora infestans T30-4]